MFGASGGLGNHPNVGGFHMLHYANCPRPGYCKDNGKIVIIIIFSMMISLLAGNILILLFKPMKYLTSDGENNAFLKNTS